jgi:hypothetical protein
MFEFLAQNFAVAGGILAAVPVLLHMLRRTPAVRMPFSLVRFLTPTLPRTTRRSRIENWPLLLLRILAVTLIALAFSRPFQRVTVPRVVDAGIGRRIGVLLDSSASMRRDGLGEALLQKFRELTAELESEDVLSVSVFSDKTNSLLTADEWKQTDQSSRAALLGRVEQQWRPDWSATHLDTALLETAEQVSRERLGNHEGAAVVVVLTDFQEGSRLDGLRSAAWPDGVKLELRMVKPEQKGNRGLSLAEDQKSGRIRVRATASGDAPGTNCTLQPFDAAGKPIGKSLTLDLAPGQRRTVTMPDTADDQPQIAGIELLGDPHPFDNVVDLPVQQPRLRRILHAGSTDPNDEESMRYYLQRVFDGQEAESLELSDLITADGVSVPPPEGSRLTLLTDTLPENLVDPLRRMTEAGGVILAAVRSVEMAESLKRLLPEGLTWTEAEVADYAILTANDLNSRLLAPFADSRLSDFSSIRFWHYRQLQGLPVNDSVKVLAAFDSGSPAIVEFRTPGDGRIFLMTAGWQPQDSQLALSSRFPPLLLQLVRIAFPGQSTARLHDVGTSLALSGLTSSQQWQLRRPDGTAAADQSSSITAVVLDEPGRWTLSEETQEGTKISSLLVTVAASESRTEPLPEGQLQAMGLAPDVAQVSTDDKSQQPAVNAAELDAQELESQQKYWRYLLLAGMACLLLESLLAAFFEKQQARLA